MRQLSLLTLSLLFFSLLSCGNETTSTSQDAHNASETTTEATAQFVKQTIDPPIADINWPEAAHRIDVAHGGHIRLDSGTEIDIPANAFVYPDGEAVTGEVLIHFREFHSAAEVILSGIPMRDWDESEEKWQNFSTAGMFDIRGTDEANQAVEIAADHPLTVHLSSQVEGTYDYWYFDEDQGDWNQQGSNTGEAFTPEVNNNTRQASNNNVPPPPVAPRKYDPAQLRIAFAGMNLSDFPELSDTKNVALQYTGEANAAQDPQENQWIFEEDWYKAELSKTAKSEVYRLYLENDHKEFTTYVRPTLLPQAYAAALSAYQQKLENYERAIQNMEQGRQRTASLRRSMAVNRFGIYNYDIYGRWEEPILADATFLLGEDIIPTATVMQVYLVTDDGRISVRYPRNDWPRFNFDRQRKNLLLGITSDSRIVMVTPQDFVNQSAGLANSERSSWECALSGSAQVVQDPAELQSIIDTYFAG